MIAQSHQDMRVDHLRWLGDMSLMREDAKVWREELDKAVEDMRLLEETLAKRRTAIESHVASLSLGAEKISTHENEIAAFERGENDGHIIAATIGHSTERAQQCQQHSVHEDLKKRHHAFMAQWSLLVKAITDGV